MNEALRVQQIKTRYAAIFAHIREIIRQQGEGAEADALRFCMEQAESFLDCGEEGVAFETLVECFCELEITVSPDLFGEFKGLGELLTFPERVWAPLKSLVGDKQS